MELNEHHRELLGMRTYLNKFALQTGHAKIPNLVERSNAVRELIANGYVSHIDTYFNFELGVWLDVFQLTKQGIALVEREGIIAVSP